MKYQACLMLMMCLACLGEAQEIHPPPGPQQLARDLAGALLVHDESIRTMRWTQILHLNAGQPDEVEHVSHHVFDGLGRWRCAYEKVLFAGDTGERVTIKGMMAHDGARLVGRDDTSQSGVIREYMGERRSEVSLDCWLGRHVDLVQGRRLGELLLKAEDLKLAKRSPRGLPVISGTVDLAHLTALLEVEVDPLHGLATVPVIWFAAPLEDLIEDALKRR